jgi:DNA replication initiation complex subunit (GINS family)
VLTFETLSRISREEKASAGLTKLPDGFFEGVANYLLNKAQASEGKEDAWEFDNAKIVLGDILKARERKILLSALGFVDSGVSPANIAPEEKQFFDRTASSIMDFRSERKSLLESRHKKAVLAFLGSVPKFVGTDLKNYGPFGKGDIANIPEELSNVLVEKGAAKKIEKSEKA